MTTKKQKTVIDEPNPLFADAESDFTPTPVDELFPDEVAKVPEVKPEADPDVKTKPEELSEAEKNEMLAIVDTIVFEGSYQEVYTFGNGKYKATFRSRTAGEDNEISQRLDGRTFNTMISYQNQSSLLTMAYSLIDLNGTDFRGMDVKARYERVALLPSPLVIILSELMSKFDQKVFNAMEFGKGNF